MNNLLEDMKRRKVFRIAAVYAVSAWILIQIADVVLSTFDSPSWVNQTIILVLALGLPVVMAIAWAFDLTPDGIRVASDIKSSDSQPDSGQDLNSVIIGLMALAVTFLFIDRYLLAPDDIPTRLDSEVSGRGH